MVGRRQFGCITPDLLQKAYPHRQLIITLSVVAIVLGFSTIFGSIFALRTNGGVPFSMFSWVFMALGIFGLRVGCLSSALHNQQNAQVVPVRGVNDAVWMTANNGAPIQNMSPQQYGGYVQQLPGPGNCTMPMGVPTQQQYPMAVAPAAGYSGYTYNNMEATAQPQQPNAPAQAWTTPTTERRAAAAPYPTQKWAALPPQPVQPTQYGFQEQQHELLGNSSMPTTGDLAEGQAPPAYWDVVQRTNQQQ